MTWVYGPLGFCCILFEACLVAGLVWVVSVLLLFIVGGLIRCLAGLVLVNLVGGNCLVGFGCGL